VVYAERIRAADRIHIVGGPGVGKSTFADAVAAAAGLEAQHLDTVAFEGPEFEARPAADVRREAAAVAEQQRWVTEGIFVGWVEPLFARSDVIVWLDHLGWGAAARRIATRWVRQALRESTQRRGRERFLRFDDYARNTRQLIQVLVTSREYWQGKGDPRRYSVTHDQQRQALRPYADKVIRLTTADETEAVLRLVGRTSSVD